MKNEEDQDKVDYQKYMAQQTGGHVQWNHMVSQPYFQQMIQSIIGIYEQ